MMTKYTSIINPRAQLDDPKQFALFFEQYKLFENNFLMKMGERRMHLNTFYMSINSFALSTLILLINGEFFVTKSLFLSSVLLFVGISATLS